MFLIAAFLRLPYLPLLLQLSSGLLVVQFELRGRRTVEELVECVEPVFATGDPRSDFRLKLVPQAHPCHVVQDHFMRYKAPACSSPICF
jgi:hypothetical protein